MERHILDFVPKCLKCHQVKYEHQRPGGTMERMPIPEWKWEHSTIDSMTRLLLASGITHQGCDEVWKERKAQSAVTFYDFGKWGYVALDQNMSFEEEPIGILDKKTRQLWDGIVARIWDVSYIVFPVLGLNYIVFPRQGLSAKPTEYLRIVLTPYFCYPLDANHSQGLRCMLDSRNVLDALYTYASRVEKIFWALPLAESLVLAVVIPRCSSGACCSSEILRIPVSFQALLWKLAKNRALRVEAFGIVISGELSRSRRPALASCHVHVLGTTFAKASAAEPLH
ncbi:hypothetical protein MTR67_052350 [Solanum verrucosum]|uniref:Uncharacterized protein n=1 Tax=Solanum verrucosum TaxID=315347 RepID=A0AAF0V6S8_SOLVR|nr:hypothetical protein MTR67_052350 [Solanum verrucosum]